jgi:hypothetical protein
MPLTPQRSAWSWQRKAPASPHLFKQVPFLVTSLIPPPPPTVPYHTLSHLITPYHTLSHLITPYHSTPRLSDPPPRPSPLPPLPPPGNYCSLTCGICQQPVYVSGAGSYSGVNQIGRNGLGNRDRFFSKLPRRTDCEDYDVDAVVRAIRAWASTHPANFDIPKLVRAAFHDAAGGAVVSRQSSVISHKSSVISHQSSVISHQSSVIIHHSSPIHHSPPLPSALLSLHPVLCTLPYERTPTPQTTTSGQARAAPTATWSPARSPSTASRTASPCWSRAVWRSSRGISGGGRGRPSLGRTCSRSRAWWRQVGECVCVCLTSNGRGSGSGSGTSSSDSDSDSDSGCGGQVDSPRPLPVQMQTCPCPFIHTPPLTFPLPHTPHPSPTPKPPEIAGGPSFDQFHFEKGRCDTLDNVTTATLDGLLPATGDRAKIATVRGAPTLHSCAVLCCCTLLLKSAPVLGTRISVLGCSHPFNSNPSLLSLHPTPPPL